MKMAVLWETVAERLRLQLGDRVVIQAGAESRQFRVVGIFETESARLIKKDFFFIIRHQIPFRKGLGRTIFQLSIQEPDDAVDLAHQMQLTLGIAISWQEREKVWLEVFGLSALHQQSPCPAFFCLPD